MKNNKIKVPSGGVKGVVDLLNHLDPELKKKIVSEMEKKDPKTTEIIKKNLLSINDLKFLNANMIRELLKDLTLKDLILALKLANTETLDHICKNVSKNIASEIKDQLISIPVKKSLALESLKKVMDSFSEKVEKGIIVLDRDGHDQYVD